jgi:alkylated DNA repair dioxygenase AlkB
VLLNLYRDGRNSMGWHADDEPELGPEPAIASLSLGATRRFRLRPRPGLVHPPFSLELASGSLLLMRGATQRHWQHALPKTTRSLGPRLNLTFRWVAGGLADQGISG